ncbi:hypothetical protein COT70_00215 [candidate division WWE3 bacterium CG09_land_8_20_14_0_10_47_33]|uniref:Uncharacterized protein n=1 Tax=candidate division WWE3 bacterium CG_4_9_14_0_2_um_filter_48_10 TaxID=1975078 RepID=A0A2M8EIJ9_UNCKA|nr:MAG: hypothetical protein COT70_00215 [candidate division WWE3 bacterium CG09_land_8_20_14_0_10_47_33]PIZ41568.1 MAG: hypothetical protein COY35_00130 [candidate division WWE3 bacterium CG_4_10_14_0_2_um_filter_47_8]PJC22514.1 MAG: hypothetical protein CO059_02345 [candidate division WWE3 bacterium CG_4_9_14_0_2_um_filter_48_10]PJE52304.1 MAG: hypothetical protein COV28_00320 [candidate division WWE3 bacterium CG10_big_fil_rev_8_21_14_0_10_48_23]
MVVRFISPISEKIALNTFAQLSGRFAVLTITLFITALVTRSLGRASYGDYSLARNFMLLFTLGVDFGLNAVTVREITRQKGTTQRYFANLLSLRLLIASFFIILGALLLPLFPYPTAVKWGILITLLILIPWSLQATVNTIFQANLRYGLSTFALVLGQLATLILVYLGFLKGWGLLFFLGAGLVGHIILVVVAFNLVGRFGVTLSFGGDWKLWRRLLLLTLPLGLMLIFSEINAKADLFLLSLLPLPKRLGLGQSETVGVYSLAYQIFNNAIIFPTFFMNAFFPVMVVDFKEDWLRFIQRCRRAIAFLFGVSILGLGVGFTFAPWAIRIIAGEGFEHSATALRILLLGLPLFFLTSPLQWFLVTVGKERILPCIYGVAAVFNIFLNLIFIPKFSYQASAVLVLVTEGLILILLGVASWKALVTEPNK